MNSVQQPMKIGIGWMFIIANSMMRKFTPFRSVTIEDDTTTSPVLIFSFEVRDPTRQWVRSSKHFFVHCLAIEPETRITSQSLTTSLDYSMSPTITRPLQPLYRCSPGEQTHFLVEYYSPSTPCSCTWHVQHSEKDPRKLVENGSIVNTDSSSILILESITRDVQGIYTFYVQNLYGRAMTRTMLIVKTIEQDLDESSKKYDC